MYRGESSLDAAVDKAAPTPSIHTASTGSRIGGKTTLFMVSIITKFLICRTARLHLQRECTMSSLLAPRKDRSTIRVRRMVDRLLLSETFAETRAPVDEQSSPQHHAAHSCTRISHVFASSLSACSSFSRTVQLRSLIRAKIPSLTSR